MTRTESRDGTAAPRIRSLAGDLRKLAGGSAIYGVGSVLSKALALLLLPLYTRYLTPADYGTLSIATATSTVLTFLLGLGLNGAIARFYFSAATEKERRETIGAIVTGVLVVAIAGGLLLDYVGPALTAVVLRGYPFEYIRIAIWLSVLAVIAGVPLTLYQSAERPVPYILLTTSTASLTALSIIYFVVVRRGGATGYLRGALVGAAVMVIPNLWISARWGGLRVNARVLIAALAFGLPLVPHGLATWVLDLSDRVILQRNVSLQNLGVYSLGYQFGLIVSVFSGSVNSAWIPFIYREVETSDKGRNDHVRRLVTYVCAANCLAAGAIGFFAPEAIMLLTPAAYHDAWRVVPYIAAGYLFAALYFIPGNFLFAARATRIVPFITATAAGLNIALNLLLVPRYGIWAACWATAIAYVAMFLLYLGAAEKYCPFPYQWRRIALLIAATTVILGTALVVPPYKVVLTLPLKLVFFLVVCAALYRVVLFESDEPRETGVHPFRRWLRARHS